MRTDAELKWDVETELALDPAVDATSIGVSVNGGVVTLTGHIDTHAEKVAARKAALRVAGVKAVAVELDVRLSPEHRRSDTDLAIAAEQALKWDTRVPDRVRVTVEKGWVTLQGAVESEFQRRSAEKAVASLLGVVGVSNDIVIEGPQVNGSEVRGRILSALKRQVEREVKGIEVDIDGRVVTLRGRVNSWHERAAAEGVAFSVPGVRTVINELEIG